MPTNSPTLTLSSPHTYLHLSLPSSNPAPQIASSSSSSQPPLDPLTARTHLTTALIRFLGETGAGVPIDILKIENRDVWVRVPRYVCLRYSTMI